jgi:hypothetical protein
MQILNNLHKRHFAGHAMATQSAKNYSPTESILSLPNDGNRVPLLNVVTQAELLEADVTSKKRLARFWAFSTADVVGSFSARLSRED